MDSFVTANPSFATWFIGVLFLFIGLLISGLLVMVKQEFSDLTKAIKSLETALTSTKADIGQLKDRLAVQETTCRMQLKMCPANNISFPRDKHE
jgi:hypothetical protein